MVLCKTSDNPGGSSSKFLRPWTKIQKYDFDPKNTFLISKSYSEHVSNVERCRGCVFEHQNTIWSKETTFFRKIPEISSKFLPPPGGGSITVTTRGVSLANCGDVEMFLGALECVF